MNLFLLQQAAQAAQTAPKGSSWTMIALMLGMVVVFWLFFIRPQTKKQKELQKQRDALTTGDKILTAGGIHGVIKDVKESVFVVEIARDVRITIEKSSVFVANSADATLQN